MIKKFIHAEKKAACVTAALHNRHGANSYIEAYTDPEGQVRGFVARAGRDFFSPSLTQWFIRGQRLNSFKDVEETHRKNFLRRSGDQEEDFDTRYQEQNHDLLEEDQNQSLSFEKLYFHKGHHNED